METFVTGAVIRQLRERQNLTQAALAQRLSLSDKTISKWETGRGLPDITLLEPLAAALGVSMAELFAGESVLNSNRHANLRRARLAVCPLCGNILTATGEAVLHCCGIRLPLLEAEAPDEEHPLTVEVLDGEYYVRLTHEMSKTHSISFFCYLSDCGLQLHKLYPEQEAEARFRMNGHGMLYAYCNRHGLFGRRI